MRPVTTFACGRCGREDEVDTDGAGLLGDADDRALDLLVGHHQVGQLVDDEDHVGQLARDPRLLLRRRRVQALLELFPRQLVVRRDVAAAGLREQLVPLVHLGARPLQDRRGLGHLGDDRAHQVRDVLELAHLDHLGVDQHQLQLVGLLGVEEAHDDRVHAHALARAGRAGDEHVRHLASGPRSAGRPPRPCPGTSAASSSRRSPRSCSSAPCSRTFSFVGLGTSMPTVSRPTWLARCGC
jgi:hypothetical protein